MGQARSFVVLFDNCGVYIVLYYPFLQLWAELGGLMKRDFCLIGKVGF